MISESKRYSDPYWKIDIQSTDHNNVIYSMISDWSSNSTGTGSWDEYGLTWAALKNSSLDNTHTLKKTLYVEKSGEYHVYLHAMKTPFTGPNTFSLSVDSNIIASQESLQSLDRSPCMIDCGVHFIDKGGHEFTINSPKYCYLSALVLRKIRHFSGNSKNTGDLYINSFKFTQNSINSLNTFSMKALMKNMEYPRGYLDSSGNSGFVFDYRDVINIYLGETRKDASRVFGGYITSPSMASQENTEIMLEGADRLLDFTQRPIYKVLKIGGAVSESTADGPGFECKTMFDAIKYLCSTIEYGIDYSMIDEIISRKDPKCGLNVDYSFKLNYDGVYVSKMSKNQVSDQLFGKVLNLCNNNIAGPQSTVLWQDNKNPIDASVYNELEFDYMFCGASVETPFLFDIQITFYKKGEPSTVNHIACIRFNSKTGTSPVATVSPQIEDGKWKKFSCDLKSALNADTNLKSDNYFIKKIEAIHNMVVDENADEEVEGIHEVNLANLKLHNGNEISPTLFDSGGKFPLEVLNDMLTDKGYVMLTDYGESRKNDSLRLYLEGSQYNDFEIIEGLNLISISDQKYTPKDDLQNSSSELYNLGPDKLGLAHAMNIDSIYHYCQCDDYQKDEEVNNVYYAQYLAQRRLSEKISPSWSYTATVSGAPRVKVGSLLDVSLSENYLSGTQIVKTVEYEFDRSNSPQLQVHLGLNQPHPKFMVDIKNIRRKLNSLSQGKVSNVFREVDPAFKDYIPSNG